MPSSPLLNTAKPLPYSFDRASPPATGCGKTFTNNLFGNIKIICAMPDKRGVQASLGAEARPVEERREVLPCTTIDSPQYAMYLCRQCIGSSMQALIDWCQRISIQREWEIITSFHPNPSLRPFRFNYYGGDEPGKWETVTLATLDLLPDHASERAAGFDKNDIPLLRIAFTIDDYSSMILNFRANEMPAHITTVSSEAYSWMAEQYLHEGTPLHLFHIIQDDWEMHRVLAGHFSLRCIVKEGHHGLQGVDNGQAPSRNAQRVIDRLKEAIMPYTEELMKGFNAPENDWDATNFNKIQIFYTVWYRALRELLPTLIKKLNTDPLDRSYCPGPNAEIAFKTATDKGARVQDLNARALRTYLPRERLVGAHPRFDLKKAQQEWEKYGSPSNGELKLDNTWGYYRTFVKGVEQSLSNSGWAEI